MFCTKCGSSLDDSAVICPHCGCATANYHAGATGRAQPQRRQHPRDKGNPVLLPLGALCLILGAGWFLTGYIQGSIVKIIFAVVRLRADSVLVAIAASRKAPSPNTDNDGVQL